MPIRQACGAAGMEPSSFYYRARPHDDAPVVEALNALVTAHPRWGLMEIPRPVTSGWTTLESQAHVSSVLPVAAEPATAGEEALTAQGPSHAGDAFKVESYVVS